MSTVTLHHHRGDRVPLLAFVIEDDLGVAVNLTGGRAFLMIRHLDGGPPFDQQAFSSAFTIAFYGDAEQPDDGAYSAEMFIVDAVQGIVSYDWTTLESDGFRPGVYDLMVHVDFTALLISGTVVAPTNRHCFFVVSDAAVGWDEAGPTGMPMITELTGAPMLSEWDFPMISEV
jgi:hypothetical protein